MKRVCGEGRAFIVFTAFVCALSVFLGACNLFGPKEHTHEFSNYVYNNDATCLNDGTETAKCVGCEKTDTREKTGTKKPHSFINYVSNGDATCTADGTETAKCANCHFTDTRTEKGSKKQHVFKSYVSNGDATCTANGTETAKCETCEKTDTREDTDSKLAHSFTDYIPNGDATEEADGTKTAKCDNCDATDTVIDEGSRLPPSDGKPAEGSKEEINEAKLSIHFLELGNKYTGDCTLIKCGDTEILIDAGSRKNSAATIKSYVDKYCTDGVLEYVIATHAHQDHIAGFVGNSDKSVKNGRTGILYQYQIGTFIQFSGHNTTTQIYDEYLTAVAFAENQGTTVYTAKQCWYETDGAKKQYFLDDEKTVSMNILYNYYYDNKTSDENDYSVCMLLSNVENNKTYNYLFTGDLEEKGEEYLVRNNTLPEVELFKGGHHGSYTASTEALLSVIKPKNIAICCCCGTTEYTSNPENTFPAQASLDRMAKYTENIYCTTLILDYKAGEYASMNGNIVFYYNDRLKLYCTNNNTVLKDTEWFKANRKWNP